MREFGNISLIEEVTRETWGWVWPERLGQDLLLRTFLYDITAHDPWTMAAVTALLVGGGLAASSIPARRAAMVDPIEALRTE
jgi:ABC-type lipoprotein release transport system permease subunit